MGTWTSKDPDETLNFSQTFVNDLADGEVITNVDATLIDAAGVTIQSTSFSGPIVTLKISGGNDGETAVIQLDVDTSAPQTLQEINSLPIAAKIAPAAYPGGYVAPTPANLVAAYPEFASVAPATIAYHLTRAGRAVDESWTEGDFGHGRMLLAAHYLTLAGLGTSAAAQGFASGSDEFRTIRSGSLSVERYDQGGSDGGSGLSSTRYGREFKVLQRANRGGARVTGGLVGGWGAGDNFGPWTA